VTKLDLSKSEAAAWCWLMDFPRLDWQKHSRRECEGQITVRAIGGNLGLTKSAPLVHVSVRHPADEKRYKGSGNSLYEAVDRVCNEMWRVGFRPRLLVEYMHDA